MEAGADRGFLQPAECEFHSDHWDGIQHVGTWYSRSVAKRHERFAGSSHQVRPALRLLSTRRTHSLGCEKLHGEEERGALRFRLSPAGAWGHPSLLPSQRQVGTFRFGRRASPFPLTRFPLRNVTWNAPSSLPCKFRASPSTTSLTHKPPEMCRRQAIPR